ncbi:MAG: helix-turn-helix domain-containing protein [Actinomycetota bacterium]|nr:helix-turn-helix domain-containing protein [Actinomycetota bacterium]
MLGAQRPSVNKVLRQLEDKQIISLGYGEVRILDTSALEKIAGSG